MTGNASALLHAGCAGVSLLLTALILVAGRGWAHHEPVTPGRET